MELIRANSEDHSTNRMLFAVELLKNNNQIQAVETTSGVIAGITVEKAWKGTQISKLKSIDADDAFQAICLAITATCQYFNIGKNMNSTQVNMTAELILEIYWHFRIEEILLVFKKAMIGSYGKVFDRIDGAVIMDWISQYDVYERGSYIEKISVQNRKEIDTSFVEPVEALKEIYKEFVNDAEVLDNSKDADYAAFKRNYSIQKMKDNQHSSNPQDNARD